MKKCGQFSLFVFVVSFCFMSSVLAHPGRTDDNGCHTCRTNCAKWGLQQGQYHCHNGGSGSGGSTQNSNSTTTEPVTSVVQPVEVPKSSNTELLGIQMNQIDLTLEDGIYKGRTKEKQVTLVVHLADEKTTVTGDGEKRLKDGTNRFEMKVTAEDGTRKTYIVELYKTNDNHYLNSLKVVGYSLPFERDVTQYELSVPASTSELEIKAVADGKDAMVVGTGKTSLKEDNTTITVTVTASDGSQLSYQILVEKQEGGFFSFLVGLVFVIGIVGSFGYCFYTLFLHYKK